MGRALKVNNPKPRAHRGSSGAGGNRWGYGGGRNRYHRHLWENGNKRWRKWRITHFVWSSFDKIYLTIFYFLYRGWGWGWGLAQAYRFHEFDTMNLLKKLDLNVTEDHNQMMKNELDEIKRRKAERPRRNKFWWIQFMIFYD